ncbi:MAG: hypothetical protein FWE85_03445 [Clostridiales bacterium]|nr:hypothetical protein [Clostridiales bacterium]
MGEWHSIKSNSDINSLLEFYGGFHDSCIKEIRYTSGAWVDADMAMHMGEQEDWQVDIVFQRQWEPISIELRFTGMRKMNIAGWQRNYYCDIYDCYLAFHNDLITCLDEILIVWADNAGFESKNFSERCIIEEPGASFIIAKNLLWREI